MNEFTARLKEAFGFCVKFKVPVLIGAVVFALLTTAVQIGVKSSVGLPVGSLEDVGTKLEDLSGKIEEGDTEAINKAMGELGMVGKDGQVGITNPAALLFTPQLIGTMGLMTVIMMIIILMTNAYFLVLPIEKISSFGKGFKRALQLFLPLLGLGIWAMLRSFAWIPFVGIIFAFYYFPRFIFAGVIFVKEKKGIRESVRICIERTKGKWVGIVLNYIGLIIITFVTMAIVASVFVVTGPVAPFLNSVASNLFVAFWSAFTVIYAGQIGTPVPVASHETPQV
jgi:hypothetical protein